MKIQLVMIGCGDSLPKKLFPLLKSIYVTFSKNSGSSSTNKITDQRTQRRTNYR